jgi:hypothetical protein
VTKLGVGTKVNVVLTDGSVRKGKINTIEDQSFMLDGDKTAGVSPISYTSVTSLHKSGLSKGAKIGILVAVGVVVSS